MASETRATVLVADDDKGIAEVVARVLEEEGYAVAIAYDGEAALAVARRDRPAVIIADIVMPRLDGIALAKRVAELPGPPLPVILMSGHRGTAPDPELPYLPKPFDLEMLLAMVQETLQGPPPRPHRDGPSAYLLEAFCAGCGGLSPAIEQGPADVAASLTCAACGTSLRPPIVVVRRAATGGCC